MIDRHIDYSLNILIKMFNLLFTCAFGSYIHTFNVRYFQTFTSVLSVWMTFTFIRVIV